MKAKRQNCKFFASLAICAFGTLLASENALAVDFTSNSVVDLKLTGLFNETTGAALTASELESIDVFGSLQHENDRIDVSGSASGTASAISQMKIIGIDEVENELTEIMHPVPLNVDFSGGNLNVDALQVVLNSTADLPDPTVGETVFTDAERGGSYTIDNQLSIPIVAEFEVAWNFDLMATPDGANEIVDLLAGVNLGEGSNEEDFTLIDVITINQIVSSSDPSPEIFSGSQNYSFVLPEENVYHVSLGVSAGSTVAAVPEPGTLLGSALFILGGGYFKRKKSLK